MEKKTLSEISNVQEGRQSNVKNSWLGQPQEMMCCWQMFVIKFSTTDYAHKSSFLSMPRAAVRGATLGQPLRERLLKITRQSTNCFLSLQCQLGSHCPWAATPKPLFQAPPAASLYQSMHNQACCLKAELLALPHCLTGTNTEF